MVVAWEQIRRMRGGAQAHLMRCSDGFFYVVKFQNNPQHLRVLVNEMLGTRLAWRLGLPTTAVVPVHVGEDLIRYTAELCMELPRQRIPCKPGLHFGSRYPGDPHRLALHDFLPDPQLQRVTNLDDFAGMLVFDKWTCNTNGRQTVFRRNEQSQGDPQDEPEYEAIMIDQGFCFNASEWNFPDAPLRGLYARNLVYQGVVGRRSFDKWLDRLERNMTERVIHSLIQEIPPEWYEDDLDAVMRLGAQLFERRRRVPELLFAAKQTARHPFPNWI